VQSIAGEIQVLRECLAYSIRRVSNRRERRMLFAKRTRNAYMPHARTQREWGWRSATEVALARRVATLAGICREEKAFVDNLSKQTRSRIMSAIKARHTRPEIRVRSIIHRLGFRFRVCDKHLPGNPDLAFRSRKKVIFVHGCFWHVHRGCSLSHVPKYQFWRRKLAANVKRDRRVVRAIEAMGWKWLVVWECELRHEDNVTRKAKKFLGSLLA
jgi:DNA mismatch endonuclease (patch repair protein)